MDKSSGVIPGILFAMFLAGCGGGGGTGTFSTGIPGNRPLNSLSSGETATFCADAIRWSAGLKQDNCHLTGFLMAAFQANSSPTATDAELQVVCSQASMSCLTSTTAPNCPVPAPADCAATVGALTACANDSAAQTHMLAAKVPICSEITRAAISASSNVSSAFGIPPASCQSFQAECSSSSSGSGGVGSSRPDGGVDN